jgi:hypothetical protein
MKSWGRVGLAVGGALVGAFVFCFVEVACLDVVGRDEHGHPIEGTGLVAFGVMPFAAILGAAVGVWIVLRVTRARAP